jgi:RNA polymerase sigma-70 factor (ECF subfamily)
MSREAADPNDDRRLVEAYVRHRDEESFRRLYRAATPALFRMASRLGWIRPADVEDVVQETWLRAARRMAEFRFQSSLRTWLTSILLNCMRERLRARLLPAATEPVEFAAHARSDDDRIDLDRAIAALPDGMREVFVLFDVEGLTHVEIADLLGVQPGTSKSQLFTARRKLRDALGAGPRPVSLGHTRNG